MICTTTYGSGALTGTIRIITRRVRKEIRRGPPQGHVACFAAVAGTAIQGTVARPFASTANRQSLSSAMTLCHCCRRSCMRIIFTLHGEAIIAVNILAILLPFMFLEFTIDSFLQFQSDCLIMLQIEACSLLPALHFTVLQRNKDSTTCCAHAVKDRHGVQVLL